MPIVDRDEQTVINCRAAISCGLWASHSEQFSNARRNQEWILSLQMLAEIRASQQQVVVDLIIAFR